jgi:hypothetical protein
MRLALAALGAALLAAPALAQSTPGTWNGLPDRFQVDTGYFHLTAETILRYQGGQGSSGEVHFEDDLGIDDQANTFWVDGTWRLGRRHQLKLGFTRLNRDQPQHTLTRDIVWGGETYPGGLVANSHTGSDILGGYYRFALVRKERFEVGPAVGIGYLWLKAGIAGTLTVGGATRTIDRDGSTGSITGALGGYVTAWPAKRVALHGDYLYIKASPGNSDASVEDWRGGADVYLFRGAGLGAQYKYNRYRYDRGILSTKLGGEVTFQGFQAFLSFLF